MVPSKHVTTYAKSVKNRKNYHHPLSIKSFLSSPFISLSLSLLLPQKEELELGTITRFSNLFFLALTHRLHLSSPILCFSFNSATSVNGCRHPIPHLHVGHGRRCRISLMGLWVPMGSLPYRSVHPWRGWNAGHPEEMSWEHWRLHGRGGGYDDGLGDKSAGSKGNTKEIHKLWCPQTWQDSMLPSRPLLLQLSEKHKSQSLPPWLRYHHKVLQVYQVDRERVIRDDLVWMRGKNL